MHEILRYACKLVHAHASALIVVVISSMSNFLSSTDFFRAVLKRNPAPNPVIVLWDMSADDVAKILRFMYNGEVEVKQAHLNAFLAVAERLRVRGLCQSGGKNSPNRPSSPVPSTSKGAASNSSTHKEHHRSSSHKTSTSRRSSDDKGESASKRPKLLEDSVTVKEEELERESPGKQHQESGSIQEDGGSLLSRSAAGSSESDQAEYGVGSSSASAFGAEGFDDHTGITSAALMGEKKQSSLSSCIWLCVNLKYPLSYMLCILMFPYVSPIAGMGMPPRIDPAAAKGKDTYTVVCPHQT